PPLQDASADVVDWLSDTQSLSSFALAEKTCEMVCYLWFSKASTTATASKQTSPHLSYMPHRSVNTAHLQFSVSSVFINFMHKLLQTTQLSQSVIVLSLHYVYRLKSRNGTTVPSPGSEFRVAVAGLMMANKFVDDNTYTNKTWSEVSGIELSEINKMEREFLAGINFELYVDKQTYESWVNLLKGLVMNKERDFRYFRKSRQGRATTVVRSQPIAPLVRPRNRNIVLSPRARSSSPVRPHTGAMLPEQAQYMSSMSMDVASPYRSHGKRTALDAFSPTSASFDCERPPAKRPTGLALDIPQTTAIRGPITPSPLESIQFSKLSLGSSPATQQPRSTHESTPAVARHISPQTLVAAYRLDQTKPRPAPQTLYFYSLAGSPLAEDNRARKGRLHYHQPPPNQPTVPYPYQPQPAPVSIQSAHASPHYHAYTLPPVLPHPHDGAWAQPRPHYDSRSYAYGSGALEHVRHPAPPASQDQPPSVALHPPPQGSVRSAPFANAGPPGVQYY
ncbi:cyclin-domain-containing protein, partial [Vararia minispora EC-137]